MACPKPVERGLKNTEGARTSNEVGKIHIFTISFSCRAEGINAVHERRSDAPKGLGDFQRRLNRDRDRGWDDRRDYDRRDGRGWDSTPRSVRGPSGDAPSVRVPNVGWDSTPRHPGEAGPGWGGAGSRQWDAPTPRAARGGSPDGEEAAIGFDMREWEEEQVRLDRDWYSGAEEGGVTGNEEHNPLAQYEDLSALKQAEISTKQVVCSDTCCDDYII